MENVVMSLAPQNVAAAWLMALMSESTIAVLLLLSGVVALVIILAKQRMLPWQGQRIRIGPKDIVKIIAGGIRRHKCPACLNPIESNDPVIHCTRHPRHRIHQDCRELAGGKCPQCGEKLE
jgi:hypothetical protein